MARKDNKGRNLKTGEYQRPDGRYEYRYKDEITGKRNSVYAADLASLREMEKKINKDMEDLLITDASVKKLTVNTLFERYMATKNIKERTKKNYIRMWDYRIRNTLGNIRVVDFKTSHVRTFFSALSDEGLAHSTIKGLYGLLNPSFELAVEDGIIRKNPVIGTLGDYGAPVKEKEALTLEDLEEYPYLSFEQGDYNSFYFSEEILSTLDRNKNIKVRDRATLFNLAVGLDGYTVSSGVISKELNGENIIGKPLLVDEYMRIGTIVRKEVALSRYGKVYMEALKKYTGGM